MSTATIIQPVPQVTTSPIKVLIAIPTNSDRVSLPLLFVKSLVEMVKYSTQKGIPTIIEYIGSLRIDLGRHKAVQLALKHQVTHILWLDDDMTFQPDVLEKLLAHKKEVVSALYSSKTLPFVYYLWDEVNKDWSRYYYKTPNLQESLYIATGCLLTQMTVFERLKYPWFLLSMDAFGNLNFTEDVYFSQVCRQAGIQCYVDVSLVCGHIVQGTFPQMFYDPNIILKGQLDVGAGPYGNVKKVQITEEMTGIPHILRTNLAFQVHPSEFVPQKLIGTGLYDGLVDCMHTKVIKEKGYLLCHHCGKIFKKLEGE